MTVMLPPPSEIIAVISGVEKKQAHTFANAFRGRRDGSDRAGWDLLAQVFDLHFRPRDVGAPFGPMSVMDGKRSMIPDDLTDDELDQLKATLTDIEDPEYRARIADVLWVRRKDVDAARIAIETYLQSGERLESPDQWVRSLERYERAIRLAKALGKRDPLLDRALDHLLSRVRFCNGEDKSWPSHRSLSLLHEFRHGDASELAAIAAKIAKKATVDRNFERAWKHSELEAKLHRRGGNIEATNEALRAVAERMADQAEAQEVSGSFMGAHKFWNDAIQAYRRVPNSNDRIKELHRRLNLAGEKMRAEMKAVGTEIDLSEPAKHAREAIAGLTLHDALCTFVVLARPIDPTQLRSEMEKLIEEHPLQAIIQADIFDAAGRKVDVRPSALTDDSEQYDRSLRGFMDQHAGFYRQSVVMGTLSPAMRKFLEEHTVDNNVLEPLMSSSAFVPPERLSIFVRGIRLGFEWDFSTALHLLVPQVENSLRHVLAENGVITTTLDSIGIEEAWPLGRILNEPQLASMLTEALAYELRSLLLGQPGSNIRNLLAHGMIGDDQLNGHTGAYLWWIILKLIILVTPQFQDFADQHRAKQ